MEDDEDDLYGASGAPATKQPEVLHNGNGQSVLRQEDDARDQEEGETEREGVDQDSDSVCL